MTLISPKSIQIPNSPNSNTPTPAWNRIEEPMWQGSEEDIRKGLPFNLLAPTWQMFLMGDGAPTRHLQLLTQSAISVDVVAMTAIGDDDDQAPADIAAIAAPRIRRQIWLRSQQTGEVFSHATSWWSEATMQKYLKDPSLPIWVSLNQKYTELYRDLKGIYKGRCPNVAETFGSSELDTYWARHYLLWHGGEPITMIYEIYSPAIGKYLGSSSL
ncbi:chorismate lyase [Pseudanabaena sp. FACHB-1998]|uniref:chorismate lyase n=1 Tax=Pseudanabaena sp. FACHB-1998 TaxID=2692858 RepID=UPI001680C049|nr:chorismate lyase [Pseudanabaena sp. FACHB-1998]MBD2178655.1 chorismate lyase [Pseudanabaena sp. FACHB-1998]